MKKSLFLNPPSYEGFDGGAGARYQAKREVKSNWYPTWLGQLAALVPGSKLVDAPASGKTLDDVLKLAKDYELLAGAATEQPSAQRRGSARWARKQAVLLLLSRTTLTSACLVQRQLGFRAAALAS